MNIRLEQPSDYRKVENLTREAFWNVYRPGCYEHFVLNQFRNNPDAQDAMSISCSTSLGTTLTSFPNLTS